MILGNKKVIIESEVEAVLQKREKCLDKTLSGSVLEEYLLSIQNLDMIFRDIKYSLLLDMNMIEMKNPDLIYPDFYIQKKKMMGELALSYCGNKYANLFPKVNNKHIAIFTNTWKDDRYSIGIVIATLANEFQRQGYTVAVFVENQYKHDEKIRDFLNPDLSVNAEDYHLDHEKMLLPQIMVFYSKGDTVKEKIIHQMDSIFEYKPVLIIDMADENSCCSRVLYEKFPVFYFPMRSNHGTSMFFQRYLAVDPQKMKQIIRKYHCFDEELIVPFIGGITEFPKAVLYYNKKEELGTEDAFVLVTVGNRLLHDLSKDFICFMLEFLKIHSHIIWVLVGKTLPDYLLQGRVRLNLEERIILRGYERDLIAFYQICDVYVNPMRKGGGLSIAWAMHEGLPVAMIKYLSDGLAWIGEENVCDGSMEELGHYILALSQDRKLFAAESDKMKKRVNQRTVDKSVRQIIELLAEL